MKKLSTFLFLLLLLFFSKHTGAEQQPAFRSEEIAFKSVMFNRLMGFLIREHDFLESEELAKTVAEWHDPIWSQLISLLKNRTEDNRKATRESFIAIAEKWEGELNIS